MRTWDHSSVTKLGFLSMSENASRGCPTGLNTPPNLASSSREPGCWAWEARDAIGEGPVLLGWRVCRPHPLGASDDQRWPATAETGQQPSENTVFRTVLILHEFCFAGVVAVRGANRLSFSATTHSVQRRLGAPLSFSPGSRRSPVLPHPLPPATAHTHIEWPCTTQCHGKPQGIDGNRH